LQVDPSPQLTEHTPLQVMLQVELLPQETVALAPTAREQVELWVQVRAQDCPHEPLQMFSPLQKRLQLAEPPQLSWETLQDSPWTQMQVAPEQSSGLPLQPAQSIRRRQDPISARMEMREGRSAQRVRASCGWI
jgi:hypothetical protein